MNFGEENLSSWLISTTIPCHVSLNSDIFYLSSCLLQKYCSANVRIKVEVYVSLRLKFELHCQVRNFAERVPQSVHGIE